MGRKLAARSRIWISEFAFSLPAELQPDLKRLTVPAVLQQRRVVQWGQGSMGRRVCHVRAPTDRTQGAATAQMAPVSVHVVQDLMDTSASTAMQPRVTTMEPPITMAGARARRPTAARIAKLRIDRVEMTAEVTLVLDTRRRRLPGAAS